MNIDKFVNDNADKIEKIIFDSQGNVKEIQLKTDNYIPYYPWYPYVEPYIPEPWYIKPTVTWGEVATLTGGGSGDADIPLTGGMDWNVTLV